MVVEIKLGKGMISESWEIYLKNIALLLCVRIPIVDSYNKEISNNTK